ncbi:hypothetical protein ACFL0K_01740 [Patescibacteria group bacterium]
MDVKNKSQKKKSNTSGWDMDVIASMHILEITLIIVSVLVALVSGHYKYAFFGLVLVLIFLAPTILYYIAMKTYPSVKRYFKKVTKK